MRLVLFGGIQGVGKTTLLSWLENKFTGKIRLFNSGELFRRYFYHAKIKTLEEIEELIVTGLAEAPNDSLVVVHWHYAVRRPTGYIPQISFSRLKRLAEGGKIEKVFLFVVDAPADVVLKRRLKDGGTKDRPLSPLVISEEIAADEEFLRRHQTIFAQALGDHNVSIVRLTNTNLEDAKLFLDNFFQSLLK